MDLNHLYDIRAIVLDDLTGEAALQHPDDIDFGTAGVLCLGAVGLRRCECTSSTWQGTRMLEYADVVPMPGSPNLAPELVRALIAEYSSPRVESAAWLERLYALPDPRIDA